MKNNSKYIKYFLVIIIGILTLGFFLGLPVLRNNDYSKNEDITSIKSSDGTITIYDYNPYGTLFGSSALTHGEQEYFEWSISTLYGPGFTWYIMNNTDFVNLVAFQPQWRTRGNFSYTELISDEEVSASGIFYPNYSAQWWLVAINHWFGYNCSAYYTDFWLDDFITVTAPTSTSSWSVGTSYNIDWTWGGDFDYVNIDLYHDGNFLRSIVNNTQNDGSYLWNIPSDISLYDDLYQVNVSNSDFTNTSDISDAYFEIIEGTITVTSPSITDSWETETSHSITWTSTGSITDVKIELFKNNIFELEIVSSTPNDGSFPWIIPSGLDNSTQYQVKITDVSNSLINDYSDYFEIYTEPSTSGQTTIPGYDLMILIGTSIISIIGLTYFLYNRKKSK